MIIGMITPAKKSILEAWNPEIRPRWKLEDHQRGSVQTISGAGPTRFLDSLRVTM